MEELRHMYELPYLAHFINAKRDQFKFATVDIRGFEASICDSESKLFEDIACRLLRYVKQEKDIRITSCEQHLKKFADDNRSEFSHLVKTEIKSISAPDKLRILKWLADQTKEKKNDLDEMLNEEFGADGQDPTIINVGQDSENRIYWYFDDLRLYRQKNGQPKTNCDWQCLAISCDTWEELIKHFSQSTDEQEQELHTYLSIHIYPAIKPMLEAQAKDAKAFSNEQLISAETREMEGAESAVAAPAGEKPTTPAIDQSELIKFENPELSKVLSEEPSTGRGSTHSNGDTKKSGGIIFTQQQNQLFVFSTQMANKAAEATAAGAHPTIIMSHLDDPDTKNFLRANPMKVVIPSAQSRLPMLPQRATNPFRQSRTGGPMGQQVSSPQWNGMRSSVVPAGCYSPSMMARPQHFPGSPCPTGGYVMNSDMKSPMGAHPMPQQQPDISHQFVPDENLTPDQRQRRETGLASLRKIHQMLLADESNGQTGNMQPMTDFSHINMAQDRQGPFLPPCSQSPSNFGMHQPMSAPHGAMSGPHGAMGGPHVAMGGPHGAMGGPHGAMGGPHGAMGGHPGAMGGHPGAMGGPHGAMGGHPGAMVGHPGAMVGPHSAIGGPPGAMGGLPCSMGGPQGPTPGPQVPMGGHPGSMGAPLGAMYGPGPGLPMSPAGNPVMMETKPPPPYPIPHTPSPGTAAAPAPKKTGRKRKGSVVPTSAPTSPLDAPAVKAEKQSIAPSPLASQVLNSQGPTPTSTSQCASLPSHAAGQIAVPKSLPQPKMEGAMPTGMPAPMRSMAQQTLARQHSLPNIPQGRSGVQPPSSYRMLQVGQPTPYQNSQMFGSGDAPPSYNSLRRGMSVESMTVPPSQQQQYMQPEHQERLIERQLNASHRSTPPVQSCNADQQSIYNSASASAMPLPSNIPSGGGESALTNITSSSLANLAKGVEQNISEMSQKMAHGGPFGDMQSTNNPDTNSDQPNAVPPNSSASTNQQQQQPSVNNTFVNTHMSIGQVNIQNVTANQTYQGPGMHGGMQQHVDVSMTNFPGGMPQGPQPDPMYKPPQPTPAVSIQNKGRNTIQYLPVSQPSIASSHEPVIPSKPSFDFMSADRFPSPTPNFLPGENPHMPMSSVAAHPRHLASMYGAPVPQPGPPGGHMMPPSGAPAGMTSRMPRAPGPQQYMMSAQQSNMSMSYNPAPAAPAAHPSIMESHMHMRAQHAMMSGAYPGHPGAPPGSFGAPSAGYAPPPGAPPSGMAYGPPMGGEYIPSPAGHHMAPRVMPMQQSMMVSHQGSPYMGNPGAPPYM